MANPRVRTFNIFLIRKGVRDASRIFSEKRKPLQRQVSVDDKQIGRLYIRRTELRRPRWLEFFSGVGNIANLDLVAASSSAVLLVPHNRRLFAVVFGHGRHMLDPGVVEQNFGLRISLNAIHPDRVRTIDRAKIDIVTHVTHEQASREVRIEDFGLDPELDMLKAVTGPPTDASLGRLLTGRDAVSVKAANDLASLKTLLGKLLAESTKADYKKKFGWVDNWREVREEPLLGRLDTKLVAELRKGRPHDFWLAVPLALEWSRIGGFRFGHGRNIYPDVYLHAYLDSYHSGEPGSITLDGLKTHRAACLDESQDLVSYRWPIYRCLNGQLALDGRTFVITDGSWYEIDSSFADKVRNYFRQLPKNRVVLPLYGHKDEDAYNRAVARAHTTYALMHSKDVTYGGGHSRIEFCDLYGKNKKIVHVKRYSSSGPLSHLFNQGLVSADLFLNDEDFRNALSKKLPSSHRLSKSAPRASAFEIVFAIVTASPGPLELPFFSLVALRAVARRLRAFGLEVSVTKVEMTDEAKKAQRRQRKRRA